MQLLIHKLNVRISEVQFLAFKKMKVKEIYIKVPKFRKVPTNIKIYMCIN